MRSKSFGVVAPSLLLGLCLVTSAVGRPQGALSASRSRSPEHPDQIAAQHPAPTDITSRGGSRSGSAGAVQLNQNIVNRIFRSETLSIGRNARLIDRHDQINRSLFQLSHTTPTSPAEARLIQSQIARQLAQFDQIGKHLLLNKTHIGNTLPLYDAQVARSLQALQMLAPNSPRVADYVIKAMRHQQAVSGSLQTIQTLPPATPNVPSS
jgi:hypothetical protein